MTAMTPPAAAVPRLTSLSHGGGCGCKIAPGMLADLLKGSAAAAPFAQLLVGLESADDAAVYQLSEHQALVATTDFFMPIVDDPFDFGRIAAANALSDEIGRASCRESVDLGGRRIIKKKKKKIY